MQSHADGLRRARRNAQCRTVKLDTVDDRVLKRHDLRADEIVLDERYHGGIYGIADEATRAGLIINATSLGMKGDTPLPATAFRPGQLVIDLAYGPDETPLVRAARAASAEAVDGREMLLGQGAAAFTLWTGRSAPIAVMRAALEAAADVVIWACDEGPVFTIGAVNSLLAHYKSGKLRVLAAASERRSRVLPEVPTIAESGMPGYHASSWHALFAPAGTPREIVARLHTEVARAVRLPDITERLLAQGVEPVANTPEQLAEFIKSEIARWARVVKERGMRAE